jgi:integrase
MEWDYLRRNPFKGIKSGKIRKQNWHYFSPEEFKAIIDKTEDLRTKALYTVMYFCGLRLAEALNLFWDGINIDFEKNKITLVNRTATQEIPPFKIKDYEERSVPMPKQVIDILTKLQDEAETGNPFVFITKARFEELKLCWKEKYIDKNRAGDWIFRDVLPNALKNFKKRCKDAGIKFNEKMTIHCLRKSYATNLANAGTPVHTLMKLMGHSNIATCQKYYLKSSDANEERAVKELEKICVG